MKCPRCQSSKIDASGICLTCGYEVSQWKKKLEQRLHSIRQKEEKIQKNLQFIIDAAVSRQSEDSSSPESGDTHLVHQLKELAFLEPDDDEPFLDLFVNTDNDAPAVSDVANAEYAVDSGHSGDVAAILDVEDAVHEDNTMDDESSVEVEDADYDDSIVDDDGNAQIGDIVNDDDFADDSIVDDDDNARIGDIVNDDDFTDDSIVDDDIADVADNNALDNEDDIIGDDATDDEGVSVRPEDTDGLDSSDTINIVYPVNAGYFPKDADIQGVPDGEVIANDNNNAEAGDSPYILNAPIPEGRLIFLSRTLSGLIDLFLIVLFTGAFLCTADFFTDAPMLNSVNVISFSTLFLMNYFLYSIFFLGTNGQTIGMIMTDLRVESINKKPLLFSQVVRRSAAFLVSLFGLGIGLLTGVISSECLCMHDRLSETRVIRRDLIFPF